MSHSKQTDGGGEVEELYSECWSRGAGDCLHCHLTVARNSIALMDGKLDFVQDCQYNSSVPRLSPSLSRGKKMHELILPLISSWSGPSFRDDDGCKFMLIESQHYVRRVFASWLPGCCLQIIINKQATETRRLGWGWISLQ